MKSNQTGFTLVELVAVMILGGIVAAIAFPRLSGTRAFNELGFVNETLSALRYAQKTAIASRRTVCVAYTATSVTLTMASTDGGTCNTNLVGPAGQDAPFTLTSRNSGASFNPVPSNFSFNALGQPSGGQQTISIRDASGVTVRTLVIEQETGYVRS